MNSLLRNQAGKIGELIDQAGSIGIIIGQDQNFDTVAAALGLYLTLNSEGKSVQIVSKKEPIVEVSSLVGIDRVRDSFDGVTKILTISVPYREGEIEKVSYNIEGDKLNVNLFAEENGINFSDRDVQYIKKGSSPSLIISVGVSNENDLTSLVDLSAVKTIHIDHNPMNSLVGDAALIDPSFSSVSEIVASLIIDLGFMPDVDAMQNLLDGIVSATHNFTSPSTSPFAFEAAGFLLQNGAKRKVQDRPRRDSFPAESHFLDTRPEPRPQNRVQSQGQNQPRPKFDPNRGKQQNNQPLEDLIQKVQAARQSQGQPGGNMPRPARPGNNQPRQNQNPFIKNDQNVRSQANNLPVEPISAPKEVAAETKDMPDEAQYTEGSTGEIPDDWFLPKVFKSSKRGN